MPRIKTNNDIPDIQNTLDGFPKKYIPKVGSRNIVVPMEIIRRDGTINPTKAIITKIKNSYFYYFLQPILQLMHFFKFMII